MKKGTKGEVVLSACQVQATRLNNLEYRRLQNHIRSLRTDLQNHLARLHREEQGLKYHFTHVVRVVQPKPAYQLWKQAHAHEIAQDEAKDLIESMKLKRKLKPKTRRRSSTSSNEVPSESLPPLLVLLDHNKEKTIDPISDQTENFLRPKTSPVKKSSLTKHRSNPLLALLDECSINSNNIFQQQQQPYPFESSSFHSSSSMGTTSTRRIFPTKLVNQQKTSNLDALYRMALQNQTAYTPIEKKIIEQRKLNDKEFASQHRALQGSIRMTRLMN